MPFHPCSERAPLQTGLPGPMPLIEPGDALCVHGPYALRLSGKGVFLIRSPSRHRQDRACSTIHITLSA